MINQGHHWNYAELRADEWDRGLISLLAIENDGAPQPIGTGFLFGAFGDVAIACTAAHTLAGIKHLQQRRSTHHPTALREFLPQMKPLDISSEAVRALYREGPTVEMAEVDWALWDEMTDVAILAIRSQASAKPFNSAYKLSSDIPDVGQEVAVLGYSSMLADGSKHPSGIVEVTVARKLTLMVGRVIAHHLTGHDLCKGPCLETSIPVFSGMSGSPVMPMKKPGVKSAMTPFGVVSYDLESQGSHKMDRAVCGSSFVALLRPYLHPNPGGGPETIVFGLQNAEHVARTKF